MKKIITVLVALWTVFSAVADEACIGKDMLGTETLLKGWRNHQKAKFSPAGGPEGKSFITISAADAKEAFQLVKFMPSAKLKGRKVVLYGKIKAENVAKAPKPWLGIKFLMAYQSKSKKGHTFKEGKFPRNGSFDWKEFETSAQLPEDLSSFSINIGLQETSGTIHISDVELKFED
jgi:hypothetical protein